MNKEEVIQGNEMSESEIENQIEQDNEEDTLWDDDEPEFIPCNRCDGHPACEDFGCAFKLGLGRKVVKNHPEPGNDDWT